MHDCLVFQLHMKQINKFKPMVCLFDMLPRRLGVPLTKSVQYGSRNGIFCPACIL